MVTYDSKSNPITVAGPQGHGSNLVPNSDFAFKISSNLPVNWTDASSGASVDTKASDAATGASSLKIQSSTPAYDRMSVKIPVTPNETYNLSAFLKTVDVTTDSKGYGAGLTAHWLDSSGTTNSSEDKKGLLNSAGSYGWSRGFHQITAPSDASYLELECDLYGSGTVWFDGIQLEPVAHAPNLLLNSSFQDNVSDSTLPDNWTTSGLSSGDKIDNTTTHNGLPSLLVNGSTGSKSFQQTVNAPQYNIGGFVLSGWSKQSGATASYPVKVTVKYGDGTSSTSLLTFSNTSSTWQYKKAVVPVKSGPAISGVTVEGDYNNQGGKAWFNDVELRALPWTASYSVYNYAQNPGFLFNYQKGTLPDDWQTLDGDGTVSWNKSESYDDDNALQIHAGASGSPTEKVANNGLIPYQSGANYTAIGYVHTEGLGTDSAYVELQALDSSGNVLGTFDSNKVGHTGADENGNVDWTHVIVNTPASKLPSGTANVRLVLCQDGDSKSGDSYFDNILLSAQDLSTHSTYDSKGNYETSTTNSSGNKMTMTPDPNTGFVTSVTDPSGNKTSYTANKFDETTGITLPTGSLFKYGYDANGNLTKVTDPNNVSILYGYNELNQVKSYTETVDGANKVTSIHHDGNGQVTEIDRPNNTSTKITYNGANQPSSVLNYKGSTKSDGWNFVYDGVDNLLSMQKDSASSATKYGYDANDNLTSVTEPVTNGTNTEKLTLDPDGNVKSTRYQLGSSTGTSWSIGQELDILGKIADISDGNITQTYIHDDHGNLLKSTDSTTGQAEFFNYDPDQRVSHVKFRSGNGLDLSYQYDANGRITKVSDDENGKFISYTYNSLDELTQETTLDGKTISYTYDNVGNRTSMSGTENGTTTKTTYAYNNEKNRLMSITTNGTTKNVTYDGSGNILSDGTNTYIWDAAGKLSSVKAANGTTYSYQYDGLDRRISAYGNTYHYNGQTSQIAYISDTSNNLVARFMYDAEDRPAYMTLGGGKTYRYIYDGQNDVVGLMDVTSGSGTFGKQVVSYSYDAWGNLTNSSDTSGTKASTINPFTYRGYVYDSQTKLYYLNARYYNPATGRFLSEDPTSADSEDVLSVNPYVYGDNDPINNVDPSGEFVWAVGVFFIPGVGEAAAIAAAGGVTIWGGAYVYHKVRHHFRHRHYHHRSYHHHRHHGHSWLLAQNKKNAKGQIASQEKFIREHEKKIRDNPRSSARRHWEHEIRVAKGKIARLKKRWHIK